MKKNKLVSDCWTESRYITRYMGSGVINTIVGFGIIFSAMAAGFSPMISNIFGYTVGFTLGFLLSKKFVFRSDGHFVLESVRYLIAFIAAFLFNLLVLHLSLNYLKFDAITAQIIAAVSYTLPMYLLTRLFVFGTIEDDEKA
jgi:putative flippase GtrA